MIKRLFDFFVVLFALIILSPFLLIISIMVAIFHGWPIVFVQERPGLDGKPFRFLKFRSMTNERDDQGQLLDDDLRLTKFGKFIRKTSLDELPSLWNVLVGDMSLVGPRPLLMRYLPRYNAFQKRRHAVKPGITGWAQVNGRNAISWEKKFEYDVWYVDNRSFWLDIKILFTTVFKVLKRDGIFHEGTETMPEFRGTNVKSI